MLNLVGGFQALGTLLSVGLMMLPAAAARFWTRRVEPMCVLAVAIGFASCVAGLLLSYHASLPSGPAIILSAGAIYIVSIVFGTRGVAAHARAPPPPPHRLNPDHGEDRCSRPLRLAPVVERHDIQPRLACPPRPSASKVVASFSIIGDFAKNVGGDRIALTTLVGPNGDAHVYEPKPADAAAMARADVVLVNGLHFEGFLQRLVEASGTKATVVELTKGVRRRIASSQPAKFAGREAEGGDGHGDIDPHAFQSIANARIYVKNIADAFCAADAPAATPIGPTPPPTPASSRRWRPR